MVKYKAVVKYRSFFIYKKFSLKEKEKIVKLQIMKQIFVRIHIALKFKTYENESKIL